MLHLGGRVDSAVNVIANYAWEGSDIEEDSWDGQRVKCLMSLSANSEGNVSLNFLFLSEMFNIILYHI